MASNTQDVDIEAERAADAVETESGLEPNIAGALSYLFGFITGLLFFVIEGDNRFVRFHAAQSMVVSGLFILSSIAVSVVGTIVTILFASLNSFIIGSIISLFLGLLWLGLAVGGFAIWAYLMVTSYRGETIRLPVVAGIADRLV
ncbi:hypothetical protein CP556_09120 [Natrinema sp. CBA1119]|uniref:DUF4870 domain-containing protein n=1 Tax=Natrinema sp. CBA1119 TaxID=1608465 RepID=UPI000BF745D0|nr:hypothetical protein [Natrinema sp. CBA1119]PGF16260.1 hypothetical protein CP556_09120 [Natrinema sp. CBA1119]